MFLATICSCLFLIRCAASSPLTDQTDPLEVTIANGQIRGHELTSLHGNTYYGFQEIPYATPPIGNLRFKEPVPPQNWEGILDATKNTKTCLQIGTTGTPDVTQTEDCLYLNVYTPVQPGSETEPLSILFWIHGGGFLWGDGTYQYYGPGYFMDYNIIVVSINYRLGPLGFLTTADGVIPANVALKDMVAAINWTRTNIQYFGGDPDKITIVGESSGAHAVGHLLQSTQTGGLFRGAILQSGTSITCSAHQNYPKYYAYQLGSAIDPNFTEGNSSEELLELLQNVSAEEIQEAATTISIPLGMENLLGDHNGAIWTAVIEDDSIENPFLVGPLQENMKSGNFNPVPTLLGFNSEEEVHFLKDYVNWTESLLTLGTYFDDDLSRVIHNKFNMTLEDKVKAGSELRLLYTDGLFHDNLRPLISFLSDEAGTTPMIRHAVLQSAFTDVYLYQFSYKGILGSSQITIDGPENVGHFEELYYMWAFRDVDINTVSDSDILTHQRLLTLWTNFVKYLNPTPEEDDLLENAIWPKVTPTNVAYFNINVTLEAKTDPKKYKEWQPIVDKYAIPPLVNY